MNCFELKAMINLFYLSAGIAGTKLLTDRARRDGSPVRRNGPDVKRTPDPAKVHVEDKLEASDMGSSSKRSNATPMKMLLAKGITKEVESKRKSHNVVARLMGLEEDISAQEPMLHSAKRDLRKGHSHINSESPNKAVQQQGQHHCSNSTRRDIHMLPNETVEYNDVYEVSEAPSRTHHFQERISQEGRSPEDKSDRRIEIVRQKFMEAMRLATDENLINSEEFQEALKVLSSNRDLFMKFLEEPNYVFSKQMNGLHTVPAPPQTRRITVLKPIKSVESRAVRQTRTERVNEKNGLEMRKLHQSSHSKDEVFPQPTRIIVLKPSPRKPSRTKVKQTPRAAPFELIDNDDFYGDLEDNEILGSRRGCHQRDECILSSVYSNGYAGDESSFSTSEIDNIEEDGGSFSDSEVVSPVPRQPWDFVKRHGSYFSRTSHSPESSVTREAKRRLSQRWAMVACTKTRQEQLQLLRSSCTLGELLSLQKVKKEDVVAEVLTVPTSQSCGMVNEFTTEATCITCRTSDENGESYHRNLARSRSVPVSSSKFYNIAVNAQNSNPEGCKAMKEVARSNKGKPSLKGRFSNLFISRSKKPTKEKATSTSHGSDEMVEVPSASNTQSEADQNLDTEGKVATYEGAIDDSTMQTSTSASKGNASQGIVSIEVPLSSERPCGNLDKLGSNGGLKSTGDQPSPSSVLDAPFEDSNSMEPESSGSTTCSNQKSVSRCSAIESVACALSWEDTNSESPLPGAPKQLTLLSNLDADELECHALLQKIISSAVLHNAMLGMPSIGWYLPARPLDPALSDDDNTGKQIVRIVNKEVEGRAWVKLTRLEVYDITREIEEGLLEELVVETMVDLSICCGY